jgi:hypothetical protein
VLKYARGCPVDLPPMGIRLRSGSRPRVRAVSAGAVLVGLVLGGAATAASSAPAARSGDDLQIATSGTLAADDLPAGFSAKPDQDSSAENIRLAKGVSGCAPYVTLQKTVAALPSARSPSFEDATRRVSNEVDVFKTDRAASAALALYAKPSLVGCLEKLFEKRLREDPAVGASIDDVAVTLERQDIAGLGDDSVVYEGSVVVTGTDGSTKQLGVGNAAVRVGRVVDAVSFSTTGGDLVEIVTPVIDSSVGRLRTALGNAPA